MGYLVRFALPRRGKKLPTGRIDITALAGSVSKRCIALQIWAVCMRWSQAHATYFGETGHDGNEGAGGGSLVFWSEARSAAGFLPCKSPAKLCFRMQKLSFGAPGQAPTRVVLYAGVTALLYLLSYVRFSFVRASFQKSPILRQPTGRQRVSDPYKCRWAHAVATISGDIQPGIARIPTPLWRHEGCLSRAQHCVEQVGGEDRSPLS